MAFLFVVDNTNRAILPAVWPQIRIKRHTYELLKMLSEREEQPMVDIVRDALTAYQRVQHAQPDTRFSELVELETFLRELRVKLDDHAPWPDVAAYLIPRAQIVAQSHAFVRGMIHGL